VPIKGHALHFIQKFWGAPKKLPPKTLLKPADLRIQMAAQNYF